MMPESKRKTDTGSPADTAGCGREEAKDGTQDGGKPDCLELEK